jgi:hypothetical protein
LSSVLLVSPDHEAWIPEEQELLNREVILPDPLDVGVLTAGEHLPRGHTIMVGGEEMHIEVPRATVDTVRINPGVRGPGSTDRTDCTTVWPRKEIPGETFVVIRWVIRELEDFHKQVRDTWIIVLQACHIEIKFCGQTCIKENDRELVPVVQPVEIRDVIHDRAVGDRVRTERPPTVLEPMTSVTDEQSCW